MPLSVGQCGAQQYARLNAVSGLQRLARYCARNPISLERLSYDDQAGEVTYASDKSSGPIAFTPSAHRSRHRSPIAFTPSPHRWRHHSPPDTILAADSIYPPPGVVVVREHEGDHQ
jgi:hypothetical protein